jgi:zinc protease
MGAAPLLALSLAAAPGVGSAAPARDRSTSGNLLGTAERVVLENGLTVLLLPEPGTGLVSVGMMYRVGSKNEAAGTTGLAHYAEHMNFRATRKFPDHEITESVTRRGGRWTGYTWIDQTFYQTTLAKDGLGLALDLEADRMGEALYDEKEFEQERTSVVAELRSYDDPHSLLYDEVLSAAFAIHPYRNNTIGWLTDVESVTRDEAYRFYKRYYHPRNAVLAIGGDFESASALNDVRARFAAKAAGEEDAHVPTVEPPPSGERRLTVRKPGSHAEVLLAFRAPALHEADFPALVVFDALLAGGKGLRFLTSYETAADTPLRQAVVASGKARSAASAFQASRHPYVFTLKATTGDAEGLPAAEEALFAATKSAAMREWTPADFARARREVRAGLARDLDTLAGRVHQLAFFEVSGGFEHLRDAESRLEAVTASDVRRFAREWLLKEKATVGWFVPTPGVPVFTGGQAPRGTALLGVAFGREAAADRATPVPGAPSPGIPSPRDRTSAGAARPRPVTLSNGLRLAVAAEPRARLVALHGRVEAGAIHEAKAGASVLAAHLFALSARAAGGPPLVLSRDDDPAEASHARYVEFHGSGLPEDLPALARAVARGLGADPAKVDEARQAAREAAAAALADTGAVLGARARAALFPPSSPLARSPWGDEATLASLSAADLGEFTNAFLGPARTELVVAGPVEATAVVQALEAAFTETRGTTHATSPRGPRAEAPPTGSLRLPALEGPRGPESWTVVSVPRADAAQNDIQVAVPGDRSRVHDRAATSLLLYLLGETYYSGRLGRALVEPGLVYSVWTTREEAPGLPGYLLVRTAASQKDTPEVLRRIRDVLEGVTRGAFTEDELREAKTYLRGKAARERDGALLAARAALEAEAAGPSPQDVTLAQLNDTARRLFARGTPLALVGGPGE